MKSGKRIRNIKIDLGSYSDLHLKPDCSGEFYLTGAGPSYLSSSAIGPILVPLVPTVSCPCCNATYITPEFEDWVEMQVAEKLIVNSGSLTKKQLRFLRQHFNLTQEELARKIGVSDKHEIAKMESSNNNRQMDFDKQLRLKMQYATMLNLQDASKLLSLAIPNEKPIEVDPNWFDVDEIRKRFVGS